MRKISEMYRLSGGTDYRNTCYECSHCERIGNQYQCLAYNSIAETEIGWKPSWIACKFFGKEIPSIKLKKKPDGVQMNIFDYPEVIP